jgi:protocatechuate 3,4-dioxygenase beta subunit
MNDMTRPDLDPPYLYPGTAAPACARRRSRSSSAAGAFDVPGPRAARIRRERRQRPHDPRQVRAAGREDDPRGRLLDADGRPIRRSLVEIWQANASGRYHHPGDQHDAPLDPNFEGIGRTSPTTRAGTASSPIKPGSYPWSNHAFAWRPQHIHFSLLGNAPVQRLITQMYFPGDPMLDIDPSLQQRARPGARAADGLHAGPETRHRERGARYRFDIVLAGAKSTPLGI